MDKGYLYVSENFAWESTGYYWKISGLNEVVDNSTSVDEISSVVNNDDIDTFADRELIYQNICKIMRFD